MGLRKVACAACGALAIGWGAMAQETVKLEYKLKPGTELVYKVSGTFKGEFNASLSGSERFVIGEVDEKTGVMLIGQAPNLKFNANDTNKSFDTVSACRMDRSGKSAPRKPNEADNPRRAARFADMVGRPDLDPAALPAGAVALGATWESATDTILHGLPKALPAKLVSTLAEIKVVDGHKCALIKSKVSPSGNADDDIAVTGEVETLFDIEGGFSRSVNTKIKIEDSDEVAASATLDSVKSLPAEEAARTAKLVRALEPITAFLAGGEYDKAAGALEKLKDTDPPEPWKAGIEKTALQIRRIMDIAQRRPGLPPPPAVPAEELFADGQKAMQDGNWTEAVAKFKELAEKYPNDSRAAEALTAAAAICENRLNDAKAADELHKKAAALNGNR